MAAKVEIRLPGGRSVFIDHQLNFTAAILKENIERKYNIPSNKLLLWSNGEQLEENNLITSGQIVQVIQMGLSSQQSKQSFRSYTTYQLQEIKEKKSNPISIPQQLKILKSIPMPKGLYEDDPQYKFRNTGQGDKKQYLDMVRFEKGQYSSYDSSYEEYWEEEKIEPEPQPQEQKKKFNLEDHKDDPEKYQFYKEMLDKDPNFDPEKKIEAEPYPRQKVKEKKKRGEQLEMWEQQMLDEHEEKKKRIKKAKRRAIFEFCKGDNEQSKIFQVLCKVGYNFDNEYTTFSSNNDSENEYDDDGKKIEYTEEELKVLEIEKKREELIKQGRPVNYEQDRRELDLFLEMKRKEQEQEDREKEEKKRKEKEFKKKDRADKQKKQALDEKKRKIKQERLKKTEQELKEKFESVPEADRIAWLKNLDPKLRRQAKRQFNLSFGNQEDDDDDEISFSDDEDIQLDAYEVENIEQQEERDQQNFEQTPHLGMDHMMETLTSQVGDMGMQSMMQQMMQNTSMQQNFAQMMQPGNMPGQQDLMGGVMQNMMSQSLQNMGLPSQYEPQQQMNQEQFQQESMFDGGQQYFSQNQQMPGNEQYQQYQQQYQYQYQSDPFLTEEDQNNLMEIMSLGFNYDDSLKYYQHFSKNKEQAIEALLNDSNSQYSQQNQQGQL